MSCRAAGYSLSCNKRRHKWKLEYKGLGKTKVRQDSQTCCACCGFKSSLAFETSQSSLLQTQPREAGVAQVVIRRRSSSSAIAVAALLGGIISVGS